MSAMKEAVYNVEEYTHIPESYSELALKCFFEVLLLFQFS